MAKQRKAAESDTRWATTLDLTVYDIKLNRCELTHVNQSPCNSHLLCFF